MESASQERIRGLMSGFAVSLQKRPVRYRPAAAIPGHLVYTEGAANGQIMGREAFRLRPKADDCDSNWGVVGKRVLARQWLR